MKKLLIFALLPALGASANPKVLTLSSPDGRNKIEFSKPANELTYSVSVDGKDVILPSRAGLNITNGESAISLRPLYPRQLAYSNFVHDYPEDLYWEEIKAPTEDLKGEEEYCSFHLPGITDKVKGVTAITLKDSPDDKNLPKFERREGKDWIGVRMTHNGKVTDLYINQLADGRLMHMNSWIDADGWNTDAYMLAVSYPEGGNAANPEEMFICYGSSVRRDGTPWFSSLSKLNVVAKPDGKKLDVAVSGQPKMNFKVKGKPSTLTVNGAPMAVKRDGDMVKIKISEK